jgi:hypothetical protein
MTRFAPPLPRFTKEEWALILKALYVVKNGLASLPISDREVFAATQVEAKLMALANGQPMPKSRGIEVL